MASTEMKHIEMNMLIYSLYKDVTRYNLNIPYDLIEHIRTDSQYAGMYQLLEMMLSARIGCIPNNNIEISSPHKIIEKFAEVYNIKISPFTIETNSQKLLIIYERLNIELMDKMLEPSYAIILMLIHDKVSTKLDMPLKYNILNDDNYNKIIINIELRKYSQEDLDNIIQEFEKNDQQFPSNYIKFMTKKNKLIQEGSDIPEVIACIDMLFPQSNIHPLLKKYKDLMTMFTETKLLSRMRLAKKYEYIHYKIINIPYEDYSILYNHVLTTMRVCFESDINGNHSKYIEYIDELMRIKSAMVNTCTLSDHMSLLFKIGRHKDIYQLYIDHRRSILYGINGAQYMHDNILNIIYCVIASASICNKNSVSGDFSDVLAKHFGNIAEPRNLFTYQKIQHLISWDITRNDYITKSGYDLPNISTVGETCLICLEVIDDINCNIVKCNNCRRELGHIGCVVSWLAKNNSCPMCRFSIESNHQ